MATRQTRTVPVTKPVYKDTTITLAKIDVFFRLARVFFIGTFFVLAILAGGYALRPFAGQVTILSVFFSFLADIKFVAAITLAGGAGVWAVAERILRRRKTEQLQGRIIDLEKRLDPNRTSSELTPQGTTNPKDR